MIVKQSNLEDKLIEGLEKIKSAEKPREFYESISRFSELMQVAEKEDRGLWVDYISKYGKVYFQKKEDMKDWAKNGVRYE